MAKRRVPSTSSRRTRVDDSDFQSSYEDSDEPDRALTIHSAPRRKSKKPKLTQKPESDAYESTKPCQPRSEGDIEWSSHSASTHVIQSSGAIKSALLRWFADVYTSRAMPWRKPYNPLQGPEERGQRAYEVWISEVMLQQTQVSTVIPYYNRWMKRFPTIRDLAAADIDEVNSLWKGLGYYSRASRLLSGAQKAVAEYNGRLPDNAKDLEANISGIGRYSAGAISSIAYGECVPVLDGNVHRLMSRFLALHAPPKSKATLDVLWAAAAALVKPTDKNTKSSPKADDASIQSSSELANYPGNINQALIELGSTVCKVRDPTCGTCPLRPWCQAYEMTQPDFKPISDIEDACTLCHPLQERAIAAYPMKAERKKPREELDIVNVIEWRATSQPDDRWFLMTRRPDGGLLAGLYEFPTSPNVAKTTSQTAQYNIPQALLSDLVVSTVPPYNAKTRVDASVASLHIVSIKPVGDVLHVFSHIKKTYRSQWVVLQGGKTPPTLKASAGETTVIPGSNSIDGGKEGLTMSLQKTDAMWVQLKDVPNTNMGTGVVKVWNSTKRMWEEDEKGS